MLWPCDTPPSAARRQLSSNFLRIKASNSGSLLNQRSGGVSRNQKSRISRALTKILHPVASGKQITTIHIRNLLHCPSPQRSWIQPVWNFRENVSSSS